MQVLIQQKTKRYLQNCAAACSKFDLYQAVLGVTEVGALE